MAATSLVFACSGKGDVAESSKEEGTGGAAPDVVENTGGTGDVGVEMGGASASGGSEADLPDQPGNGLTLDIPVTIDRSTVTQVDLLFVVDNSVSMADKQELFKNSVPGILEQLTNPPCVDEQGENPQANTGTCPAGFHEEFPAVRDLHVGVISSSLGGHGSSNCRRGIANADSPTGFWDYDDQGHLIPTVRASVLQPEDDPDGTGFLAWNGGSLADRLDLIWAFSKQISAVGEFGCGFEAPLEAWYRFLVDPSPPSEIVLGAGNRAEMKDDEIDTVVLAQREAFLRPGGVVGIIALTDEDDCSAMDGGAYYNNAGFGYLVAKTDLDFRMSIATPACAENPNDKCCLSCLQANDPPVGCESEVSVCDGTKLSAEADRVNVRCFDNKRRFSVDLLYPVQRYIDALTQVAIIDARTGEVAPNALLAGAGDKLGQGRDPGRVFFAGIVGVPWQDLATVESLNDDQVMEYLPTSALYTKNVLTEKGAVSRWDVILGDPGLNANSKAGKENASDPRCGAAPVPPLDPFMIPSIEERPAGLANPISGDVIVPSTSNNPLANGINGHEVNNLASLSLYPGEPSVADLQYACTYQLETPRLDCAVDERSCDCGDEPSRNSPLCQPPTGGSAANNQYFAKAYPSPRILSVLRGIGENAIVGSICPKIPTGDDDDPNVGYNPTSRAIGERLAQKILQTQ